MSKCSMAGNAAGTLCTGGYGNTGEPQNPYIVATMKGGWQLAWGNHPNVPHPFPLLLLSTIPPGGGGEQLTPKTSCIVEGDQPQNAAPCIYVPGHSFQARWTISPISSGSDPFCIARKQCPPPNQGFYGIGGLWIPL